MATRCARHRVVADRQVIVNEPLLIQFKNKQSWTFKGVPKTAMINALVSLSLDPASVDTDFIRVKYHKDQADRHDYSHEGFGFHFKASSVCWRSDTLAEVSGRSCERGDGRSARQGVHQ